MQRYSHASFVRFFTVAVSAFALLCTGAPPCHAAPATTQAAPPKPSDEIHALAKAKAAGKSIAVESLTSETSEVVANPDGSLTLTSSVQPVRVKRSGGWVPVETTLVPSADGWLRPQAAAIEVAFAAGAKAGEPLAKLTSSEGDLSMGLPFDLPAPQVSGSSLKYAEVLPGVDLQVDMFADAFTEVLIVKNAVALKDPRLAGLKVKLVTSDSLHMELSEDGSSQVVAKNGRVVFHSPVSSMWDSKHSAEGGAKPSARDRGLSQHPLNVKKANSRQARFAASSESTTVLDVVMPEKALVDPVFPVFVDPAMSASVSAYASVWDFGWTEFNQPGQRLKVGNCSWPDCSNWGSHARSYFSMNISALSAREGHLPAIRSVSLNGELAYNAASWSTQVNLHAAGAIGADMKWPGSGSDRLAAAWQSAPGPVEFRSEELRAWIQTCIEHGWQSAIGFALISPDESDRNLWKQFDHKFILTINYQYQTGTPIVSVGGVCPLDRTAADLRPTLRAVATTRDVSAGSDVRVYFNIRATDASLDWTSGWLQSATGSYSWPVPAELKPNKTYEVKAKAVTYEEGRSIDSGMSPWSQPVIFSTDDDKPPAIPLASGKITATSRLKAEDITVTSSEKDVVGFAYAFTGENLVIPALDERMCGTFADGFVTGIVPAIPSEAGRVGMIPFPWWRSNVFDVQIKAIDAKGRTSEAVTLPVEAEGALEVQQDISLQKATLDGRPLAVSAEGRSRVEVGNGKIIKIPVVVPTNEPNWADWQLEIGLGLQQGIRVAPRINGQPLTQPDVETGSEKEIKVVWSRTDHMITKTLGDLGIANAGSSFTLELVADCGTKSSCTFDLASVALVSRMNPQPEFVPGDAVRTGTARFQALWAAGEHVSLAVVGLLPAAPQIKVEGKDTSGKTVPVPVGQLTANAGGYSFVMPALDAVNGEAAVTISAGNVIITIVVHQGFGSSDTGMRKLWSETRGRFGWPIGANAFERATIVTRKDQVRMVIPAPLSAEYSRGNYGQPLRPATVIGGGLYQEFEGAELHSVDGVHAVPVATGLRAAFHDKGGYAEFGFATSAEWALRDGARQESFQWADLFWVPWSGIWAVRGAIRSAYLGNHWGGPWGRLGLPRTEELAMPGGGVAQSFEGGSFYWSPSTGAQAVIGGIGATYVADGGPRGTLGYPTSEEIRQPNGLTIQRFEHGEIQWGVNGPSVVRW